MHHHAVILLVFRRQMRLFTLDYAPPLWGLFKIDMRNLGIKGWHLECKFATGIQRKAGTVEHLVVLTTDHIEINQRQFCLDHAGDHMVQPGLEFAAVIRGPVRYQQKFSPCFG